MPEGAASVTACARHTACFGVRSRGVQPCGGTRADDQLAAAAIYRYRDGRGISGRMRQCPGAGAVGAAALSTLVGMAPPSSSQRWISARGNLRRSRRLRRSREIPATRAPITSRPVILSMRERPYGWSCVSVEHRSFPSPPCDGCTVGTERCTIVDEGKLVLARLTWHMR